MDLWDASGGCAKESSVSVTGRGSTWDGEMGSTGVAVRVLHACEGLSPRLGGTAVVVAQVANYCAQHGLDVSLSAPEENESEWGESLLHPRVRVTRFGLSLGSRLGLSWDLPGKLQELDLPDVIHIHGLWRLYYAQVARHARARGVPCVLSTHGMLEPWALQLRRRVKRLARLLFQDRVLEQAACLHATTPNELRTIRKIGFRCPVAVIPWGVEIPPRVDHSQRQEGLDRWGLPRDARVLLFLSRIHPVKGLDLLLQAWSRLQERFPEWVLIVAGYGEGTYQSQLHLLARELGVRDRVKFVGPAQQAEKETLFSIADLLVLPSYSESFAVVVAEALAHEVPVVTTKATPWSCVERWGCGWWVEARVEPLLEALEQGFSRSVEELRRMGQKGRNGIRESYSVDTCGGALVELYDWTLGRGGKPDFVREGPEELPPRKVDA